MQFQIQSRENELCQLPADIDNLYKYYEYITCNIYPGSLVKPQDNKQIMAALLPFLRHNIPFYFKAVKPNIQNPENIKAFPGYMRFDTHLAAKQTAAYYMLHFINTSGCKDEEEIYKAIDAQYPLDRMLTAVCTVNPGHRVRIIKSQTTRTLLIVTNAFNPGVILKLIAVLPVLFDSLKPEAFPAETTYPQDLFIHLGDLKFDEWLNSLRKWQIKYAEGIAREEHLKKIQEIKEQTTRLATVRIQQKIDIIDKTIAQYAELMMQKTREKNGYLRDIAYYNVADDPIHELLDYVSKKREIKNIEMYGESAIGFDAFVKVDNYDLAALEHLMKEGRHNNFTEGICHAFFKNVFLLQKHEWWTYTAFYLSLIDGSYGAYDVYSTTRRPALGVPNVHLIDYGCWGNNKAYMAKALNEKNYIIALEQAVSACRNLNVEDWPVFDDFPYMFRDQTGPHRSKKRYNKAPSVYVPETGRWYTFAQYAAEVQPL